MIINYDQTTIVEGIVTFPDFVPVTQPLNSSQIVETVFVQGNVQTTPSVGGTVDD